MRVAAVQIQPRSGEAPKAFVDAVRARVRAAGEVDLVVLPELWQVGYFQFDRYADEAEPLDGPIAQAMSDLAVEVQAHVHVGSLLERSPSGDLANTSMVIGPDGRVLGTYRKIHVFGYGSREAELVRAGTETAVVPVDGVPVGLAICYDLRFPELFRGLVDRGAEVVVVPATWPLARIGHWQVLLRARAIENLAAVVGCNATGTSGGVELGGHTVVVGPWGDVLEEAGREVGTLTATIDIAAVRAARADFPALDDRRLDAGTTGPQA